MYDDPAGDGNPDALWQAFGEQGWLAVMVPEEADGLGLGLLDAAVHQPLPGRRRGARAVAADRCSPVEAMRLRRASSSGLAARVAAGEWLERARRAAR